MILLDHKHPTMSPLGVASGVTRLLWLPVGKVTFACYSSSLRSLICLAWEKYKLAQVLHSILISEWI